MRLIKINAPLGYGEKIIQTAFSAGIGNVSVHGAVDHAPLTGPEERDVIDIETSTPKAKHFIDKLLAESYYDPLKISFSIKQPRSLVSRDEDARELTSPMCEPPTDLYEELWQFSHVTYGLIGRIFVSACLLAYGLIESKILLIIGGLLFLPVLPMVMAICYGFIGGRWKLAGQGLIAFAAATAMLFVGGVAVAAISDPPLKFDDIGSIATGILISIGVGIAAELAAIDDTGRRELIGLAAASQIGLIPVWLGIITIFGLPAGHEAKEILMRILSFGANLSILLVTITLTQLATGAAGNIRKLSKKI